MPYFPPIQQDQYPATDEVQCVTIYIPAGDEFKALLAGLISLAANIMNYANPESAQTDGLAAVWDEAYSYNDWSGCIPMDIVPNNEFYAGAVSGTPAVPEFRAIQAADIAAALTVPPPIGATTPNTGKFTTLEATGATGSRALVVNTSGIGLDAGERIFWKNSGGSYVTALQFSGNALNLRAGTSGLNMQNSGGNAFLVMSDAGAFTFRNAIASTGVTDIQIRAGAGQGANPTPLFRLLDASGSAMISVLDNARDVQLDTTNGTKWGTSASQKQGWWGATPAVRQVLATGAGKTVDDVIAALQNMGLVSQT